MYAHALRAGVRVIARRGWRELTDVGGAQLALITAQLLLWRRPIGGLLDASRLGQPEPRAVPVHERVEAARLAIAHSRAARFGIFRPRCLVRALALHQALERRGIHGSCVRIGVRSDGASLLAHAWVEHQGIVLGDTTSLTSAFTVLTDARLMRSYASHA